jgi:hypothetical protein
MAVRCSEPGIRAVAGAHKFPRSARNPVVTRPLRKQLAVIAPSLDEVVRYAGGWLFDLVSAGWDGKVLTTDRADPRPLQILGARVCDLETTLAGPPDGWCLHAIMAEAKLYRSDLRIRRMVYRARREDLTELMLWGDDWPEGPDGTTGPVRYRLSMAARAFKAHALAAAAIPAGSSDDIEVFQRTRISRLN